MFDPTHVLGNDGPIANSLEGYESREPQVQMANAVKDNFANKRHLFCEAGTGTGKSYAFLVPAIELALSGQGPIVISTNTITLQEQIFEKDIPDLKRYLNVPHLKVVLRKGRGNYISKRRLQNAHNVLSITEDEEREKIEEWSSSAEAGSLQEMESIPNKRVWREIASDTQDCLGKKCKLYHECFYYKSKGKAASAHIIITNHALLALDLILKRKPVLDPKKEPGIMPPFKYLIIDEAHGLEAAIRRAKTFEWKQGSAARHQGRITNKKRKGLLDTIVKNSEWPEIDRRCRNAILKFKEFVTRNNNFFNNVVKPFVEGGKKIRGSTEKRVMPLSFNKRRSKALLESLKDVNASLSGTVIALSSALNDIDDKHNALSSTLSLLKNFTTMMLETESDLTLTLQLKSNTSESKQYVTSASGCLIEGKPYFILQTYPIFVKEITKEILFSSIPSIVLTSATLTTNKNFSHITNTLGAVGDNTDSLLLGHVFDYQKNVKLYLTPKMPLDPWNDAIKRKKYHRDLSRKIEKYIAQTEGNAFVLCTSNKQMYDLYEMSKETLEKRGIYTLCQNKGMTKPQLIKEFKAIEGSVLYGVESFWTGVDIPGDKLKNVIITKLPFSPPTPLSEAQEEIYKEFNANKPKHRQRNHFSERVLPAVALKLKQGFGRLIRRKDDSGIVVILDQRISTKYYGKILLRSLPKCRIYQDRTV